MTEQSKVIAASEQLAASIARKDVAAIRTLLAPGFRHRTHGGEVVNEEAFLGAVAGIPGDIVFVKLDTLQVDVTPTGALVTGIQHAQVRVDGQTVNDRRRFIDWFVSAAGEWRIQAAVDVPGQETE